MTTPAEMTYAAMADQLASRVDERPLSLDEIQQVKDELSLAKAQVYATLAVAEALGELGTYLDGIQAALDMVAGR